jgi:hypothetical protein
MDEDQHTRGGAARKTSIRSATTKRTPRGWVSCGQVRGLVLDARIDQIERGTAHDRVTARGTGPSGYKRLADCGWGGCAAVR